MNVLGLDIGGTKCAVTACEADNDTVRVLEKQVFATNTAVSCEQMIGEYFSVMRRYIETYGCCCIGISCGGPLDSSTGTILSPPNLPNFIEFHITEYLEKEFGLPAFLQNDANACALAEWLFGAGKGTQNMAFLTFGTGLGAGLILDGKLYEGTNGNAGEVGHVRLDEDGPIGFGKRGSFEGFCSGGGLAQLGIMLGEKALKNGETPSFYDPEHPELTTAKTIAIAADSGDKTAREVYRMCGKYLGKGLSVLVDLLNPQRIVIGSIYTRSEHLLKEACLAEMEKEALGISLSVCEVVPAQLAESIGDFAAATVGVYGMKRSY